MTTVEKFFINDEYKDDIPNGSIVKGFISGLEIVGFFKKDDKMIFTTLDNKGNFMGNGVAAKDFTELEIIFIPGHTRVDGGIESSGRNDSILTLYPAVGHKIMYSKNTGGCKPGSSIKVFIKD